MGKDSFTKQLREMYPANSDYYIGHRSTDEFIEYWCDEVLKKSDGAWDNDVARKVMSLVISSH